MVVGSPHHEVSKVLKGQSIRIVENHLSRPSEMNVSDTHYWFGIRMRRLESLFPLR